MLAHGHCVKYAPRAQSGPIFNFQSSVQSEKRHDQITPYGELGAHACASLVMALWLLQHFLFCRVTDASAQLILAPTRASQRSDRGSLMRQFIRIRVFAGSMLLPAVLLQGADARSLPTLVITGRTVITQSCLVEIPPGAVIGDRCGDGALILGADGITIRFKPGAILRGAAPNQPWDRLEGTGIRIDGHQRVVVQNAQVHGFKNGLVATAADGLVISGGDFSDNYRQHLKSTAAAEDGADWLFPHHNDARKWRDEVRQRSLRRVVHRHHHSRHPRPARPERHPPGPGRTTRAIYDNDCSFLSGWGLALWRSSRNVISRNAFDFCVRGHVEGVYNRGQDSAGILCFEQSNDNVFAENSATHGGDGFFGFAGREAIGENWMDQERERLRRETGREDVDELIQVPPELARRTGARLAATAICSSGMIFPTPPAHGIEMTFSRGQPVRRETGWWKMRSAASGAATPRARSSRRTNSRATAAWRTGWSAAASTWSTPRRTSS